MNISRRTFLQFTSTGFIALTADPFAAFGAQRPKPNLRVGLTSDIHISKWRGADKKFEECLRFFDQSKVDIEFAISGNNLQSRFCKLSDVDFG